MDSYRIIQTIASTRVDHGGTSRSVPALCEALARQHNDVHLVVGLPSSPEVASILPANPVHVHPVTEPQYSRWQLGGVFKQALASQLVERCVIHDHGVWLSTNHAVASLCRQRAFVRVVSPRGMVGSWAMNHGKWKKRLAWWLYQKRDLLSADGFHATSEQEAEEIRKLGCAQPTVVIPNGLTIPAQMLKRRDTPGTRVLFMSRIHPKKGLLNLLQAWKTAQLPEDWKLILAGPDENNHRQVVEQAIDRLQLARWVSFTGPVADDAKWQAYANADLFVLPSFNENFGIVIAEAMSAGLPVITTTGTPWSILHEQGSGWWVPPTVEGLAAALMQAARTSPEQLQAMGRRGAAHVAAAYAWDQVAQRMLQFYEQLLERHWELRTKLAIPARQTASF